MDAKIQNTKSQLQAALGANFENLFQKMSSCVSYFVIFCNLVNFMHVAPAATKVKIQIFNWEKLPKHQLGKAAKAKTIPLDASRGIVFRHCIIIHCQAENRKDPFVVSSGRRSLLKKPSMNEHNERKALKSGLRTAKMVPLRPTCRHRF